MPQAIQTAPPIISNRRSNNTLEWKNDYRRLVDVDVSGAGLGKWAVFRMDTMARASTEISWSEEMNTVWVLAALVYSGHFTYSIVPTLEFTTREKCEVAIQAFDADANGKRGNANMRCVRIEK